MEIVVGRWTYSVCLFQAVARIGPLSLNFSVDQSVTVSQIKSPRFQMAGASILGEFGLGRAISHIFKVGVNRLAILTIFGAGIIIIIIVRVA